MQTSKIARLPRNLRNQVNERLDRSETPTRIAAWLKSHPEVQAVLASNFQGEPIKRQNVPKWREYGFNNCRIAQCALEFTNDAPPDGLSIAALDQMSAKPPPPPLVSYQTPNLWRRLPASCCQCGSRSPTSSGRPPLTWPPNEAFGNRPLKFVNSTNPDSILCQILTCKPPSPEALSAGFRQTSVNNRGDTCPFEQLLA